MARNRRQLRADDTRARLFASAAELFAAHGYRQTTVAQIVRHAGVAKGTFFVHFATKDAVVTELVRSQIQMARLSREDHSNPIDRLHATVLSLGAQAGVSRALSRAVLAATLESPEISGTADMLFEELFADMLDDVRAAKKAKMLAADLDELAFAGALISSYFGAMLHFVTSAQAGALVDTLRPLLELNLNSARGRRVTDREK